MSFVKTLCKTIAVKLVGEYSPYFIYRLSGAQPSAILSEQSGLKVCQINDEQLAAADTVLQDQAGYLGSESHTFGCFLDGKLVGVCVYWFGKRYEGRGFWPLKPGEAKLVQIIVSPHARGCGAASFLLKASAAAMGELGFPTLYARIWHSNAPSLRTFEKAGWLRIAFVLEINPLRTKKPWRLLRPFNRN